VSGHPLMSRQGTFDRIEVALHNGDLSPRASDRASIPIISAGAPATGLQIWLSVGDSARQMAVRDLGRWSQAYIDNFQCHGISL